MFATDNSLFGSEQYTLKAVFNGCFGDVQHHEIMTIPVMWSETVGLRTRPV